MTSIGHTRSASLVDTRNHPMATTGALGHPPPAGRNVGDPRSGGAPIPHIEDILAAPRDIDMNQSIRRLLESAEASLSQAQMSRDFNRPALALKEYIRASVIAIQSVRNHRDYASLKTDRNDLQRIHNSLLKKISQLDVVFAGIKQDIIADNKRTGVQPTSQRNGLVQRNGAGFQPSTDQPANIPTRSKMNGTPPKTKPIIQPKPQALHGNAIKPVRASLNLSNTTAQDLATRFANLRGPQASPGQDPRIKTHQINLPRPAGPREMPPAPPRPPKIDINSAVPILPKMPDAIYSPARGSISGEVSRPPTSTTRNIYNRTGSSVSSVPGTPTGSSQVQADYFTPAQSYSLNNSIPPVPPGNAIKIPEGELIDPEELYQAMKAKGSILIIDTRFRQVFNEGHIMSSSTICIEPNILTRDNISAEQISESLVLSPNQEESLFEQRDKYDLVVLYDQNSETILKSSSNPDELVLASLQRALVDYNYGRDLKNPPKLLKGGVDAWVDLMGPASLQASTQSGSSKPVQRTQLSRSNAIERRTSKYIGKPLKEKDVKDWQERLKNEDMETASSPNFLRSKEDFLRRFPPVLTEQESMTSQDQPQQQPAYGSFHKIDLDTDLPSPPTRPAPAMPRPSYNGLAEGTDDSGAPANRQLTRVPTKIVEQPSTTETVTFYTGLNNPSNWCYANSTLQCLLASPEFGRVLADSNWISQFSAPRKEDEKIDQPQLMVRIISNLFHWMSSGKFQVMKAQTLMRYSLHISKQMKDAEFGGNKQQDAQEFMSFLIDHLHDETNTRRDQLGVIEQPDTKRQSLLGAAAEYWRNHSKLNQSIVDKYWRGLELGTVECLECRVLSYQFATLDLITVFVGNNSGPTLNHALKELTETSQLSDFDCNNCRRKTRALQFQRYARLPSLLCVSLRRFNFDARGGPRKCETLITWDLNDMDMSQVFVPHASPGPMDPTDPAFTGPFRYETYAVVVHSGAGPDQGHYTAYVRDTASHDPYAWYYCDDAKVTKVRIGSGDRHDVQKDLFKSGHRVPYLIFFRRKDMR
ncbi:ubiquitin-specific protease doa4 [Neonectria magnoliae]|uniref:Ubiquitin-specific protease doa4 n=1 Tax=Neonectria magnoliae TaxID=2732573 RepID=A0ABR1HX41_9HYPO